MKILWFTNTPCGASDILNPNLNIGGWLSSLEKQVTSVNDVELFICFYGNKILEPFTYKKTTYYPIYRSKLDRLKTKFIFRSGENKEITELIAVVNKVKPDIIHIHGTEENFGLIQKHTHIPTIISLQGILSVYIKKFYSGIPAQQADVHECLSQKILLNSYNDLYKRVKTSACREKEIFRLTKHIFGRTEWDKRVSTILAPKSKYYICNEILRPIFYEKEWHKKSFSTPLKIVTTMSGGLYKGLETVVMAAQVLKKEYPIEFEWTIIGQKETNDLAKTIKHWLKVNYIDLNIHLAGSKNELELANILLESDIYCQVSHIENSPNSLCEAMLLGMPIVASFVGGTDSIIENGKEGILVQDGDPYSLAGSIIEMSNNTEKAILYGHNARVRASIRHNKEDITRNIIETYKHIIHEAN